MSEHDVDVLVLTWRDVEQTLECVRSVISTRQVTSVLVVENETSGALRAPIERLGDPRVQLHEEERNLGFAGGVNLGIRRLLREPAPYILVMNNDARLEPGALDALVFGLSGNLGMVGPLITYPDGSIASLGGRFSPSKMKVDSVSTEHPNFLTWACVLIDKRVFEAIGLLDERYFMYWEDVEFGLRVRSAKLYLATVPEARVRHSVGAASSKIGAMKALYSTMGLVVTVRETMPISLPMGVVRVLGRSSRFLVRGDYPSAIAVLRGALYGLRVRSSEGAVGLLRRRGHLID